ncbi:MAG: sugar phosphate isomerase/epimerase [Clostridia bacterium]|nr:sugar phosphate isomerase/epimerase [Clostridia bacterium]
MKIGLQLFTCRKQAQKDLFGTLKNIAGLGIKYVEAARINFDDQDIADFKKAKEQFGIEVVSAQIKPHILADEFDKCLKFLNETECKIAIISVLPTECIVGSDEKLEEFCKWASELAKKYKEHGIQLCYHHHDFEFIRATKKEYKTRFDLIAANMSEDMNFVIDTYWTTKAGINVEQLLERLTGRVRGVHLRDYALYRKFIGRNPSNYALGDGVLDFTRIIDAAKACGADYGAIEQNTKHPYSEIAKSVAHVQALGYGEDLK